MNILLSYIKQPLWNNWYIDEKIGQGTYSEVYKIYSGNKVSALKVKPVFADSLGSLNRKLSVAEKESEIMLMLKEYPYIAQYQDSLIQRISEFKYLFMIRMECLSPIYEKSYFSESSIYMLINDIGKGLEYIHSVGVVHCDVKPDNFFVSEDGIYKIGDFNISGYAGEKRYFSGTAEYTAPEVYNGNTYDYRSDIYSFGKCIANLSGNVSYDLSKIINKACAELPYRYQSINEMLVDIKTIIKK